MSQSFLTQTAGIRISILYVNIATEMMRMHTNQSFRTKSLSPIRNSVGAGNDSICANNSVNCGITNVMMTATTATIMTIRIFG